ncbi:MAG: L-seryl-tRNA(Sec) selenium transferase [Ktedonobacterales bacterium]|nr:L-seryl-tRNA(Sec) selenium transferase [Ktedonobacterales bacterium]
MDKPQRASARDTAEARQHGATSDAQSAFRALPAVDELCRSLMPAGTEPHAALVRAARAALAEARAAIRSGRPAPSPADLAHTLRQRLRQGQRPAPRPVINATGVILNTNLGRAPLSQAAIEAMAIVARQYSALEYDLESGARGSRHAHTQALLCELTGAEEALAVNNNAAAVLVILSALAAGRDVIIARGELVEIGGGFRIPDVMRQSGARLIEVGTTNRTRVGDFADAITAETALLLSVHPSNFRMVGFTEAPPLAELATLAHRHNLPLVHDLGSGCLEATEHWGLAHEPTPRESLAVGADIVCFSGDKLLGGPQAGLIVGRAAALAQIARHPLMRAVRIDKLTLAALEATLRHYRDGTATQTIPIWRAIATPLDALRIRAERWATAARAWGADADVRDGETTIGGGSLPGETLPTILCALALGAPMIAATANGPMPTSDPHTAPDIAALASRLRQGDPPVVARVSRDRLLLDPRTVLPEQDEALLQALRAAVMAPPNS